MNPTNSYRDLQPVLFINESGETIPAFGVMRVTETDPTTRQALYAEKPDGTNADCTLWINLERARPDGKTGFCTRSEGCYALFDDSDTPVPGEEWGPDDDWKLHKDKTGFIIVGGIVGSGANARVRVHPASSGGGGGAPTAIFAWTACVEPPDSPGAVFRVASPWIWLPPEDETPGSWELSGDWIIDQGSVTYLQQLDEEDDPVLVEVLDPLLLDPTTGEMCFISAAAGSTSFRLVNKSCGGGG